MNILILTTHFNRGGISRYAISLAKGLSEQRHNVWVASCGGDWIKKLEAINIPHIAIPIKTKKILSPKVFLSLIRLWQFLQTQNIDVVHANTRVVQFLAFLIYKQFRIPYVSTFHGFYRPAITRKLFQFQGLQTIAVSKAVKNHLAHDLWIKEEKIRVIYNGIDLKEFSSGENKRSEWGFKDSDCLVGILGRISSEKGHFLTAEAIRLLSAKYDNIYLIISGTGKLEEALKTFVKKTGIEKRVIFLNCTANLFLSNINILVVPSSREGFGYSIIEAFAKGIPVVGYNIGGIPEVIQHKKNGILFYGYDSLALADAIEELILHDALRNKIVCQAKDDVVYYSTTRMAIETEEVYLGVVR
jgi:glycosyltransferase involved in cell wall biosynthesis